MNVFCMDKTISNYLDFVESKFDECFAGKKYIRESPVCITSQIDPTIDFIGSKISPLKKYVLDNSIGNNGRFLIQNCMKLKSLQFLKSSNPQVFGCYYKCMGTLTELNLDKIVYDLFDYLTNQKFLGIAEDDICIRICSQDSDLIRAISTIDKHIKREIDTMDIKHYRHKYGLEDHNITGRDFNIGIRKRYTNFYFNCGTLVVMETPEKKIAVDMGLSNLSLSMCRFGTDSTVASSRMADIIDIDSIEKTKFADALIAVSTLLKENILCHPSKHFRKKFRQYLNALLYWNDKFRLSADMIISDMIAYLNAEYKQDFSSQREQWLEVIQANVNRRGFI